MWGSWTVHLRVQEPELASARMGRRVLTSAVVAVGVVVSACAAVEHRAVERVDGSGFERGGFERGGFESGGVLGSDQRRVGPPAVPLTLTAPPDAEPVAPSLTVPGITTSTSTTSSTSAPSTTSTPPTTLAPLRQHPLPADSGAGRRVVYSVSRQRVWWVDHDGGAVRTAAVSGKARTPEVGTYQVFSRSEHATGTDGSTMRHFVRFTRDVDGWAIGFHDIPEMDGMPVQTEEQLGTPLSHGCIRQSDEDARYTWDFLEVGDTVVVMA